MKAQIAAEFVLFSMLALLIVTGLLAIIGSDYARKKDDRIYYEATALGRQIQKELIVSSEVKTGFHRTLRVPDTILGENYSISNTQVQLIISHDTGSQYFNIPTVSGNLIKGENNITTNETTIIIN